MEGSAVVVVKTYAAEPVEVRKPLLNGYERGQRLGYVTRKTVYLDLATMAEVAQIIEQEFPGALGEPGAYFFEGAQYSDIFCKMGKLMNVVLNGSRRTPTAGLTM